jgi:hypothetical protein
MQGLGIRSAKKTDIERLKERGEINGLIRLLKDWDPDIRWRAADALGSLGTGATRSLIRVLKRKNQHVRLGVIEALGEIGDPEAVPALLALISTEKRSEIKFLAAIALGDIGDQRAVPMLSDLLSDGSKYVRFGAASALDKLGWKPGTVDDHARFLIAKQDWKGVLALGGAATGPLHETLGDHDRQVRMKVVDLLGNLRDEKAYDACREGITDPDPDVRWHTVCACTRSETSLLRLPMGIMHRTRAGKSPSIAALLNFLFPGIGYNYVGKWWGFLLFQVNLTLILLFSLWIGPLIPQLVSLTISSVCSVHAYRIGVRLFEGL